MAAALLPANPLQRLKTDLSTLTKVNLWLSEHGEYKEPILECQHSSGIGAKIRCTCTMV